MLQIAPESIVDFVTYRGELHVESLFQPNVPVQRRRYAVRWNRLFAERFFVALSEALEDVYATIKPGRNGQGS